MINLMFQTNTASVMEEFRRIQQRQIPFALARALTWTAQGAKKRVERRIKRVFHKPVPFVQNSVAIMPATTDRLRARVFIKDRSPGKKKGSADAFMKYQEYGGRRPPPHGNRKITIPEKTDLNAYDNMTMKQIARLLRRKDVVQLGRKEGKKPGIYQRLPGNRLKLLVSFVNNASYEPIFRFVETVERHARNRLPQNFRRSFILAVQNPRTKNIRGRRRIVSGATS